MVWESLAKYRDLGLVLLRVGVGLGFTYFHGWGKLVGGPETWERVGGAMRHFGIGFGYTTFGFLGALSESVGGLLIATGFLFRPAALFLMLTMVVATNSHLSTGQGTPAHAFKNAWLFLGLFFVGPGRYSVDHWLLARRSRRAVA